jgi:DHA1 family inner membrane transport protein
MLALYGIGLAVGNYIAAKFADRHLYSVLSISMMTTVALLILLSVNMAYSLIVPALIFFWGVTSFSIVPPLQTLVVAEAKDAPNLASSMNIAAFNLGNATGAALGGFVIYLELGLPAVALAGAGTSAMGLVLLHLYRKSKAQGSNNMEECY